jgi:hypothetical protein
MRLQYTKYGLLLGYGLAYHGTTAAPPIDGSDSLNSKAGGSAAQEVNPETFLGACPEYGQYASHQQ